MRNAYAMNLQDPQVAAQFQAAQTLANGAIIVEDYDSMIFDRVLRDYPVWNVISKRVAPGDFTATFQQTAVGAAAAVAKRTLTYSATSPTRSLDTQQEIKAIAHDLTFGIYDRSVYAVQGSRFGRLDEKDLQDSKTSCLREWQRQFHLGDDDSDADEWNGWRDQLGGSAATTIGATTSVVKTIRSQVVTMLNQTSNDIRLNALICNAMVRQFIVQELEKVGEKLVSSFIPGDNGMVMQAQSFLDTAAGPLEILVDPYNTVVSGTPDTYPTLLTHRETINWQYIPPLGFDQAEPVTFNIPMTNTLSEQNKTVMFGALQMLGGTTHSRWIDVDTRTTVVDPTA